MERGWKGEGRMVRGGEKMECREEKKQREGREGRDERGITK